jgi:hypothetical protein
MKWLVLVAGVCLVWGCSSGDDDDGDNLEGAPIDCAWLANDNCWQPTVAGSAACVPPAGERGVLSADGRSCTYASGSSINFTRPLVLPSTTDGDLSDEWDFSVRASDGSECLQFRSSEAGGKTLNVRGQTYVETYRGFNMQVICPDGEKYAGSALSLLECDNFFDDGSVHAYSWTDTSVSFSFGFGTESVQVFSCSR